MTKVYFKLKEIKRSSIAAGDLLESKAADSSREQRFDLYAR
jgi:hypothetical protein